MGNVLLLVAGCGGVQPPPPLSSPVEQVDPPAVEQVAEADSGPPAPQPEPSLSDRWRSPFAVSSVGELETRRARAVVVIGADSVIAAGRAALTASDDAGPRVGGAAVDDSRREPEAAAGREADPPPSADEAPPSTPPPGVAAEEVRDKPTIDRPRPTTHHVVPGDSWIEIAVEYGVSYSELAAANPGVNPDRIRIGQELRIPARGEREPRSESITHRVGPGDTLTGLARRYSVPVARIRDANGLEGDRIRIGQVLVIPASE